MGVYNGIGIYSEGLGRGATGRLTTRRLDSSFQISRYRQSFVYSILEVTTATVLSPSALSISSIESSI
jgi:hypothetical protein